MQQRSWKKCFTSQPQAKCRWSPDKNNHTTSLQNLGHLLRQTLKKKGYRYVSQLVHSFIYLFIFISLVSFFCFARVNTTFFILSFNQSKCSQISYQKVKRNTEWNEAINGFKEKRTIEFITVNWEEGAKGKTKGRKNGISSDCLLRLVKLFLFLFFLFSFLRLYNPHETLQLW